MTEKNTLRYVPVVVLLMMGSAFAAPGKGAGRCTDVSIAVDVYLKAGGRPMAIYGDGVDTTGVPLPQTTYAGKIKTCEPQFGVNAVFSASGSRKFNFDFSKEGGVNAKYLAPGVITVRSITYNMDGYQPFTTRVGSSFTVRKTTYSLTFFPPVTDPPLVDTDDVDPVFRDGIVVGDPGASPATVTPQPFNCSGPASSQIPPSWWVEGLSSPQVGTLGDGDGNVVGQYSMPFKFYIRALSCFAY
ncbi:MAG: hypothetical protein HY508_06290 [Acidobacteria bacterium]|nr:hypothetical protein [Acidobacteriota bacterium]